MKNLTVLMFVECADGGGSAANTWSEILSTAANVLLRTAFDLHLFFAFAVRVKRGHNVSTLIWINIEFIKSNMDRKLWLLIRCKSRQIEAKRVEISKTKSSLAHVAWIECHFKYAGLNKSQNTLYLQCNANAETRAPYPIRKWHENQPHKLSKHNKIDKQTNKKSWSVWREWKKNYDISGRGIYIYTTCRRIWCL